MDPQALTSIYSNSIAAARSHAAARPAVTLSGAGALGRPLADLLPALGVTQLQVIDLKSYAARSIATQCDPQDVGHAKAEVVARRARARGLAARAFTTDLFQVPDGIVGEAGIVVSCTDNTRALIGANRLAARMRCRLLKVNIEPRYDTISIRAYLPCAGHRPCAECQLSDRHYDQQLHPHSCDAESAQRHTDSPRTLSAAAAHWAARALADLLVDGAAARQWYGYETLVNHRTGQTTRSTLERFSECRWEHASHWSNLFWLAETPSDVSLKQLVPLSQRTPSTRVRFTFDHGLTRWVCCDRCLARRRATHWCADLSTPVGVCSRCQAPLRPFPFGIRYSATSQQLRDVYRRPLADWGVPAGAVIEVDSQGYVRTFVLGGVDSPEVTNSHPNTEAIIG